MCGIDLRYVARRMLIRIAIGAFAIVVIVGGVIAIVIML